MRGALWSSGAAAGVAGVGLAAPALTTGLALVKVRYHITFLNVVFGALLFARDLNLALAVNLALLYVSFNFLLYGGIYTLNDIADRVVDRRHPGKRHRPVASGRVTVSAAARFAVALISAGLLSGLLLFEPAVVACYLAALAINALYSLKARNTRYADVLFNSLTHPTRFLMGAFLVGRVPPSSHLLAILLLAIALACLRREVERDSPGWQARETLARYAPGELSLLAFCCLGALGLTAFLQATRAPGFYAILLSTAVVVAGGGWWNQLVRSSLRAIWIR
jgi:decaprenyl-phosphate phosphoribosyltransferase